jgi:hypothetical protein
MLVLLLAHVTPVDPFPLNLVVGLISSAYPWFVVPLPRTWPQASVHPSHAVQPPPSLFWIPPSRAGVLCYCPLDTHPSPYLHVVLTVLCVRSIHVADSITTW